MNGILTTGLAILSGVCLYTAVHHAWAGWRRPPQLLHLVFALLCLLVSLYVLAKLGAYHADSATALVTWRRHEASMAAAIIGVLPWFAAIYADEWRRAALYVLSAASIVILTVNLILPHGILFVEVPAFRLFTLPWGETVADLRVHQRSSWFLAAWGILLLSFAYAGYACVRQYRRGERRRASSLAVAIGVFLVFVLFNQAVNYGLVEFTHTAEFGFIALILLMSASLNRELRDMSEARRISEERLRATLDNTPGVAVQWFNRAGRVLYWNTASETLYGIPAAQAVGNTMLELLHTPEQFQEFLDFIATIERQGHAYGPAEIDIHSVSGAKVTVFYTMFAIPGVGSEPIFVCMDVNITERKRVERAIQNIAAGVSAQTGENFFRNLVTHLATLFEAEYAFVGIMDETQADAMTTLAVSGHGAIAPNMTYKLENTPCANVVGQKTCAYPSGVQQLFPKDALLVEMGAEGYIGTPLFDAQGAPIGIIVVLSQTPLQHTEQFREMLEIFAARAAAEIQRLNAEAHIRRMAYNDYLTGLANRAALEEHLAQALRHAKQSGQQGAMLLIDLDHFKTINDALSHEVGDLVLRDVARRLTETAADRAFVARLGGDEFVLVMPEISSNTVTAENRARQLAEAVAEVLASAFTVGEQTLNVGASIGVVLFPQAGATELDILRHADIALYRAKSQGRDTIQFFLPSMQATVDERMHVERGLRQALEHGDLLLQFQPQLNRAARVVGAEALLRWRQPDKGIVGPADFVLVAEETGLIHSIGQWVLTEACDRLKAWEGSALTAGLSLSVNVSSWQFVRDDFVRQVEHQLARSGAKPARLVLEITESALFYDIEDAMKKMRALRALGLRLSMDDFGTGYSSMSYLRKLPLNELKIDQSFVHAIAPETPDVFLSAIVAIGHAMGMTVVGEGVETEVQRDALAAMGCDGFQGYLWSAPLAADAFAEWVTAQEGLKASGGVYRT